MRRLILTGIIILNFSIVATAEEASIFHLGVGYQHLTNIFRPSISNVNYMDSYHFLAINFFAVRSSSDGFYFSASALFPISLDAVADNTYIDRSFLMARAYGLDVQVGYLIKAINSQPLTLSFGAGIDYMGLLCRPDYEDQSFSQIGACVLTNLELNLGGGFYFDAIVDGSLFFFPLAGSVSYLGEYSIGWGIKSIIGVGYRF